MASTSPRKRGRLASAVKGLSVQERKFVEHFSLHHNAAEAYGVAYPKSMKQKPNYRANKGSAMLRKGYISHAVSQRAETVEQIANTQFEITAKNVLQEIAATAFANADDYFEWGSYEKPAFKKNGDPIIDPQTGRQRIDTVPYVSIKPSSELTRVQKAAVVAAEETISKTGDRVISVKMGNKLGALTKLGEHLRLFSAPVDAPPPLPASLVVNGNVNITSNKDVAAINDKREALKAFEALRNRAITVEPSPAG